MQECDLGEQSILHAVRTQRTPQKYKQNSTDTIPEEESPGSKPLCETLLDFELSDDERRQSISVEG